MRIIAAGLAVLVAALAADVRPSEAQIDRRATWCFARDPPGEPEECRYFSFEQCMATASGIGGTCHPNYPASAWDRGYQQPQRQKRQRQDQDWRR